MPPSRTARKPPLQRSFPGLFWAACFLPSWAGAWRIPGSFPSSGALLPLLHPCRLDLSLLVRSPRPGSGRGDRGHRGARSRTTRPITMAFFSRGTPASRCKMSAHHVSDLPALLLFTKFTFATFWAVSPSLTLSAGWLCCLDFQPSPRGRISAPPSSYFSIFAPSSARSRTRPHFVHLSFLCKCSTSDIPARQHSTQLPWFTSPCKTTHCLSFSPPEGTDVGYETP